MINFYIEVKSGGGNLIPARVQNVTAEDSFGAITISWDELEGYEITVYEVWKKVNSGEWSKLTEIPFDNYGMFVVDIEVEEGNTYTYRVRAKNTEGKYTDWSNEDSVTIEEDEATVPETIPLANISTESSFNYNYISWSPAGDGGSAITAYAIQRVGTGVLADDLQEPEYIDITSSTASFDYNVAAINAVGQGAWSNDIGSSIISNLDWWRPVLTVISSSRIDIAVNNAAEWGNKVIDHYWDIQRSTDQSNWTTIASNQTDVYQDDELEASTTYYYRIVMKNEHGSSSASNVRNETTQAESSEIFNPPTVSLELKPNGIQVTWTVDTNNTIPTTYNELETIKDSESPVYSNVTAESNTTLYSTVVEDSTYKFRIRAYNEDHGYSEWSEQKTIVFSPESPLERNFQVQFEVDAGILEGETVLMDIYIPESLRTNPSLQNVGVLMFAHGNGETGNSISVLRGGAGPAKFIYEGDEYPYIVISPQRPVGDGDLEFYEAAKNHLKTIVPQANIEKIAVAGWSGGKAPYWYLEQSPESISAAICFALAAGLNPPYCPFIANGRRVWLIGADDDSFAKGAHLNFFNAMKNCEEYDETKHKMTLYVSGGHDCVTRSFREIATGGAIVSGNDYSTLSGTDLHDFIMASFDEEAPSVPEGLAVVSKTNSNIVVSWEASEDDYAGVSHYVPNIDNVDQTPTTSLLFNFTGLENNTEYDIKVKAVDRNGNESDYSEVLKVTTDEFGSPWSPSFDSQDFRLSTVDGGYSKSGTTLTAVEDLSERGNDINISGSPAIVTGLNSIDAIHFRELNDERLTIPNATHLNYTDSQFIGIVAQVDYSLTPDQWAAIVAKGDSTQYQVRRNSNQSNLFYQTGGTSPDNSSTFSPGTNWAIIVACLYDGRKIFRVNGSVISDAAFTGSMSANSFPVSIPGPADKNRFMELKLHELIIASGRDTDVIEKYEGWLAEQYDLRSVLPSEHPYKSASPLT